MSRDGAKSEPESQFRLDRVAETGSTNDDVMERARQGEAEGLVLVADVQRSGRGRRARRWEAPPGSALLSSWLFRPPPRVDPNAVAVAVGVAAVDACRTLGASDVGLKWPNDLVVADRKMGGMLAESVLRGDRAEAVVVGIGINVVAVELSPDVAETATSLEAAGGDADRESLLAAMVPEVQRRYRRLVGGDTTGLRDAWRQRLDTLGRRVRLELDDEVFEGTAVDVDHDGALLVETDGAVRRVTVADVIHLRPPTGSGDAQLHQV